MMLIDASSIIGTILSFPYFLDIVIFLFLLVGTSIGYARGFWRGTFRFIMVVILLLVAWFTLLDKLAGYVNSSLLEQLHITFAIGENEAKSIEELVIKLAEAGAGSLPEKYSNIDYLKELAFSISKSLAWLLVVVLVQFVSWILSGILYFLIIRLIIPEKVRKIKLRILGALMGLAQTVVITFSYMLSLSSISPAVSNVSNPGQGLFTWLSANTQMVLKALDPNNSMLSPYVEKLESAMSEQRFDFKVGEDEYNFIEELKEFLQNMSDASDALESVELTLDDFSQLY